MRRILSTRSLFAAALVLGSATVLLAQVKQYKPSGWNLFSPEQDVELGKEAAQEVRQTMPVVNNKELTDYVNRIGARLTKSKLVGGYPYTFEVINDPSINAFALPGGPMFVHTGLIAASDNESQLAGVLAHEISHVYLRHGTANVSKANLIQLPAMLGGAMLGNKGGIWGTLGQLGISLGAQSAILSYSRGAEKDADLHGAQIMYDVGYDPTQMAVFFDKLNEGGKRDDGFLANFLASHPTPGNRVKYVSDQNKKLGKKNYTELEPGSLSRMKQVVANLPAPPKPQAINGTANGSVTAAAYPTGKYRTHRGPNFQFDYPDNWEVFGDPNSPSVTVTPRSTLVQDQQGNVHIGYGLITASYFPESGRVNLSRDTQDLLKQMTSQNPSMRQTGNARTVKVAGRNAILTPLESSSPYPNKRELDMVLTVPTQDAVFYVIFIAPDSDWNKTQPAFDRVVSSLQLAQ